MSKKCRNLIKSINYRQDTIIRLADQQLLVEVCNNNYKNIVDCEKWVLFKFRFTHILILFLNIWKHNSSCGFPVIKHLSVIALSNNKYLHQWQNYSFYIAQTGIGPQQ